jgi:hypothetical protein
LIMLLINGLLAIVTVVALASAFFILLISKIGLRDKVILRAPKLISQMFECDFCLSFWVALVISILFSIMLGSWVVLIVPLLSAPLTRIMV